MKTALTIGTAKYKTDLADKFPAGNQKVYDAVVKYIERTFSTVKFIREGNVLYYNRQFSEQQVRELRAFTYGLSLAGYGED